MKTMKKLTALLLCVIMILSSFAVSAAALFPSYTKSELDEAKGYTEGEYDYIYKLTFDNAPLGTNMPDDGATSTVNQKRLYYGIADSEWNPYGFPKSGSVYPATVRKKNGDSADNDKYLSIEGDDVVKMSATNTWAHFYIADSKEGKNLTTGNTLSFEFDMRWQGLGEKGMAGTLRAFTLLGLRQMSDTHTFLTAGYQSGTNAKGETVADQKLAIYTGDNNNVALLDKDDESFTNFKVVYYSAFQTFDVYVNGVKVVDGFAGGKNHATLTNVRDEYDDSFMTVNRELTSTVISNSNRAHFVFCRQDWSTSRYTSYVFDIDNLYVRELENGVGNTTYYSNGFEVNNGGNFYYSAGNSYAFTGSGAFSIGGTDSDKHLVINPNGNTKSCFDIYDRYQVIQNGNVTIDFDVKATNVDTSVTSGASAATGALLRYGDGGRNYYFLHVGNDGTLYTAHHDGSGMASTGVKVASADSDKWTNIKLSVEVVSKGTERTTCDWRTGKDSCRLSYKLHLWVDGAYIKSWVTDRVAIDNYKSINGITYTPSALSADPGVTPAYYFENTATNKRFADADGNLYWLVYGSDGKLVSGSSDYKTGSIKLTSDKKAPGDYLRFFTASQTWLKGAIDNVKIYEGVYTDAHDMESAMIDFSDYKSIDELGPQFIRSEGVYIENGELVIPEGETFGWIDANKVYSAYAAAASTDTFALNDFYNVELKAKTDITDGALVTVDYESNGAEALLAFDGGKLEREGAVADNITVNGIEDDRYSDISVVFAHWGRFGNMFVDGLYAGMTDLEKRVATTDTARFLISGETRIAELYIHQGEMRKLAQDSGDIFEIDPDKVTVGISTDNCLGVWGNTSLKQATVVAATQDEEAYFKWDYSVNATNVTNNRGTVYANHYLEDNITVFEYDLRFTPNANADGSKKMELVIIAKTSWERHLYLNSQGILETEKFGKLYADTEGTPLKVSDTNGDFDNVAVILDAINGTVSYRFNGAIPYYLSGGEYKRAEKLDITSVYPSYNADEGETRVITNAFPNSGFYGIYELKGMKIYTVGNNSNADVVGVQVDTTNNNIRIIGGVDMLYYTNVGFTLEVFNTDGAEISGEAKTKTSGVVYSSIFENNGGETNTLYPEDFGWRYFFTVNITAVDKKDPVKLVITPCVTVLGEKYFGKPVALNIDFTSDSMNDWICEFEEFDYNLSSADLQTLTVGGKAVGVVDGKTAYYRATEGSATLPSVEVAPKSENATVKQTVTGNVCNITVTSADGSKTKEYTVNFIETAELDSYDLDTWLIPYWEGNIVYHETALFGGDDDAATLLYTPEHILSVRSCDLKTEYVEGVDYRVKDGKIYRIDGGRIPYYTDKQFYPESKDEAITGQVGTLKNGGYVLSAPKAVFQQNSISVTYTHAEDNSIVKPVATTKLTNVKSMLERGEEVNIVFFGDSITAGCNSTGHESVAPYTPRWTEMVYDALEAKYPKATINYYNTAVPGWSSHTGLKTVEKAIEDGQEKASVATTNADGSTRYVYQYRITEHKPDLLVLAFGMNDGANNSEGKGAKSVWGYINDTKTMIDNVLAANPDCEILLVSTMLANPDTFTCGNQPYYEEALIKLINGEVIEHSSDASKNIQVEGGYPNIDIMPMTSISESVLTKKDFWDVSSNNTNHPSDFLVRIYAQTALESLGLSGEGVSVTPVYVDFR